jgi:hypothetical protein
MLNMLKDPAKRAEWVYGQPMAPCPKCGSYNMKPQIPIAMETTGDETAPQLVGKWARATKAGATPLQGRPTTPAGTASTRGQRWTAPGAPARTAAPTAH